MKAYLAALVAVLVVCGAARVRAASFTPAPNMTFDMQPVAPEGSFSSWEATDIRGLSALRTRAAFQGFGRDPKWSPGFKFSLRSGKEEIMLSVGGQEGRPMAISLETVRGPAATHTEEFRLVASSDDEIEVELYWSPDGTITAAVSGEHGKDREVHTAKLPGAPTKLAIYVSTATVRLVPLQLGTGAP